jgi:hypothetical protein
VLLIYHYYLLQFKFSQKASLTFATLQSNQIAFGSWRTPLLLPRAHPSRAKPRLLPARNLAVILSAAGNIQANYHDDGYLKSLIVRLIIVKNQFQTH